MAPITIVLTALLLAQPAPSPEKHPLPAVAVQKQATEFIASLFKADYAAAKTTEQKSALAKKLLQMALETGDKPAEQYVLLRISKDIASGAGDATTAMEAIDRMTQLFVVEDVLAVQAEALQKSVKNIRDATTHQQIATTLSAVIEEAIAQDRFELAKSLQTTALESARLTRSPDLVKQVVAWSTEIEEIEKDFPAVTTATEKLKSAPTDPEANLLVGRYKCFVKEDWSNGLPLLALGSDEKLRSYAVSELAEMPNAFEVGNHWWEYAKLVEGRAQEIVRRHASVWYEQALPKLEGLKKKLVETRLEELAPKTDAVQRRVGNITRLRKKFAQDAVEIEGRFYKVFLQQDIPWDVAKLACEKMGGRLACIETDDLRKKLAELKGIGSESNIEKGKTIWIGAYQKSDGKFTWINGNALDTFGNDVPPSDLRVLYLITEDFGTRQNSGKATNVWVPYIQGFICEWSE